MTRAMISIGILLALIGTGIFSGFWVDRRCGAMLETVTEIRESFLSGDTERGAERADALRREWEDFRSRAALIQRNDRLKDISRLTARTEAAARSNTADIFPELSDLEELLCAMKTSGIPRLTRIL